MTIKDFTMKGVNGIRYEFFTEKTYAGKPRAEEPLPNSEFITMGWAKELADKVARQLIEANRQGA